MERDEEENTLKVPSNFNISKVDIPQIPADIIFPDELNRLLREQIRYYVHENGMLQKNLTEVESYHNNSKNKISELESKLKRYENDGSNFVSSTHVASTKIVELSKKLREKNSEVEALKTKNSKLQQFIYELQERPEENILNEVEKPVNGLEEAVKKLEEKLNYTTNKLADFKNSNYQLKNDLKMAHKLLQQEVGEKFESLLTATNSNSGWRGRAQIILDLQQKNYELRDKLKNVQDKVSKNTLDPVMSKAESKISLLSKENSDLKMQYDEAKRKCEIFRTRCKVLENDAVLLKSKYTMVKEQAERDQDVIATLSAQMSTTKEMKNDILKEKDNLIYKLHTEKDLLTKEIEEYKSTVKEIREQLDVKDAEVENFTKLKFCHRCRTDYQNENELNVLQLQLHSLSDLTELQNNRLMAERQAHHKTQCLLRQERQKVTKAEAKAAKIELESSSCRSSYSSSLSLTSSRTVDQTTKDQLELAEENIKALKTRLEIEQFERHSDLQEFRRILQYFDKKLENEELVKD